MMALICAAVCPLFVSASGGGLPPEIFDISLSVTGGRRACVEVTNGVVIAEISISGGRQVCARGAANYDAEAPGSMHSLLHCAKAVTGTYCCCYPPDFCA